MNDRHGAPDAADDEYSATVLASHWIQRPDSDTTALAEPPDPPDQDTRPDRVEGTLLRFGPGVSAATLRRANVTLPAVPVRPDPPRRSWRRHALPVLVLLAVIGFLLWQRYAQPLGVHDVTVTASGPAPGCDDTADVVATVRTDGRPGTLTYRWVRSDGTSSGVLREEVVRGQKRARLHLLWTFQGQGRYAARAELRLLSPVHRAVATHFAYRCP